MADDSPLKSFDEILSSTVRRHRVLYDKSCPGFKDKSKKEQLWREIGRELNFEGGGQAIEKFFVNLRKRYNKEKARMKRCRKSGFSVAELAMIEAESKMKFMHWIDPYLKERRVGKLLIQVADERVESQLHNEDEDDSKNEDEQEPAKLKDRPNQENALDNQGESFQPLSQLNEGNRTGNATLMPYRISRPTDGRRKRAYEKDREQAFVMSFSNDAPQQQRPDRRCKSPEQAKEDECDLFARLISSQLRTLSTMNRLTAQNSIQNVLFHAMINEQKSVQGSSSNEMQELEGQASKSPGLNCPICASDPSHKHQHFNLAGDVCRGPDFGVSFRSKDQ